MSDTLFKDLGESLSFEQSMRPFYSTPSTTIPNDSGSFAEFLYGGMISAKKEIHSLWRTILADTRYTNQRRYNLF
jgi:hypothetical protein